MNVEISNSILPFLWLRPDGIAEKWDEFMPLITHYRAISGDTLTVDELAAELSSTIREQRGAVYVALDEQRRIAGYLCVKLMIAGREQHALITQWFKCPDPPETALMITDAFFNLARDFAMQNRCRTIRLETRSVRDDGSLPSGFRRMLERFGFRPAYVGLESDLRK